MNEKEKQEAVIKSVFDALIFGTGILKVGSDGSVETVSPKDFYAKVKKKAQDE